MRLPPALRTLLAGSLFAAFAPATPALELAEHPELRVLLTEIAGRHGFAIAELEKLFASIHLRPEVVTAIERPREALPWHEYRKSFLTESHLRRGLAYWRAHARTLARAEQEYGVPPEVVLAILGVETHYGRSPGRFHVLEALTTQWLQYPPRRDFFRRELEEFLVLTRDNRLDARRIKGSYAGAIGIAQFIPSSYRRYAVDFDGDGRTDLLTSHADAIGSIGHFLYRHGWRAHEPIGDGVRLEGTRYFWIEKLGVKPALRVSELASYGIFPLVGGDAERRAALFELEGEDGPFYRIGYDNFYAITRYNRSKRYAMAVVELAEWLRRERHEEERP